VNCRKKPVAALQIQPKNYRKNLKHPEACKKQFRVVGKISLEKQESYKHL
jgi:hypothetical protein